MNFDKIIDRRGTNSTKWDMMGARSIGVPDEDGLAMWIADMDFEAPDFLQEATQGLIDKANYGYFIGEDGMKEQVAWWMQTRHGWAVDPATMFSTFGLGNGIGICLQALTQPEDEVIIFTPVYHEFTAKIRKSGRGLKESPLVIRDGVYHMDLEALEASMTGRESLLIFCSPHNPAGRIWTPDEMRALVEFCARHDLILLSDDIHHDLTYPGQTYTPLPVAAPEVAERLVMLTSASKTFNIAGSRLGTISIPGEELRNRFAAMLNALDVKPNLLGLVLTEAAYSESGAVWLDQLRPYLAENARIFLDGMAEIPGVTPMPMQSTYLTWMDFTNTGMEMDEVVRRVRQDARIAPSIGADFGTGGENFLRFNIGTPRARIVEAVDRLQQAFSDLQ
ncbi:MalY/PatB family protein [Roseovarius aestuarii]|uniref:Aminotransferase n=1 Tax=Roseovarius aestuarii TaxID=475083 RepID=A0A1X7BYD0_9RHOB|nr:PatB family C-S lyase [Roseovarius aestuarii]SMC14535.1 Cystathionine beta-lyase PatB [Roseovarius aestuarii]